jgi:hypothetical protein
MMKTLFFAIMSVAAAEGAARAGGQAGSIGIGAEAELNGLGGASLNYDGGMFDAGGFFGYLRVDQAGMTTSTWDLGGRFFYHIHKTGSSDFGLGGALALISLPPVGGPGSTRTTPVFLEPGFQIRLFIVPNVAVSFMGGLSIGLGDAHSTTISGQDFGGARFADNGAIGLMGGAGVHYYFF